MITPRTGRWGTFWRLVSHNRIAIIAYVAYILVCLSAGALGGYFGVKVGLKELGL